MFLEYQNLLILDEQLQEILKNQNLLIPTEKPLLAPSEVTCDFDLDLKLFVDYDLDLDLVQLESDLMWM